MLPFLRAVVTRATNGARKWCSSQSHRMEIALSSEQMHNVHDDEQKQQHNYQLGKHWTPPDDPTDKYQISYSLPPMVIDKFATALTNFTNGKEAYTEMVEKGNHEQEDVYVDSNAFKIFNQIFPEVVNSRQIG
jgi:hypothetical protein